MGKVRGVRQTRPLAWDAKICLLDPSAHSQSLMMGVDDPEYKSHLRGRQRLTENKSKILQISEACTSG